MSATLKNSSARMNPAAKDFNNALERHPAKGRSFWIDVLRGVALAFDPLPARRASTFCLSDQAAFDADIRKLVADRLTIEPLIFASATKSLRERKERRTNKVKGETSQTLCEAD
jgi:hypothetical protein